MKKMYFIPGSRDLYGVECFAQVAADCRVMADFLNAKLGDDTTAADISRF